MFKKQLLLFCWLLLLCPMGRLFAQQDSSKTSKSKSATPWFKLSGNTSLLYEYYHVDTSQIKGFRPRKPTHLARFILSPTITIKGKINLPFELMLSSQVTNFTTPAEQYRQQFNQWYGVFNQIKTKQDLINYVTNPINRIAFTPNYKGQKLYLGTHTPNYSEFTQGNVSIFGAGADVKIKKFFVNYNRGILQHAIQPDASRNVLGAYQRTMQSARIGFDFKQKHLIAFSVVTAADKKNSLDGTFKTLKPSDGTVASTDFKFTFFKKLRWESEVAVSKYTHNTNFFDDASVLEDSILNSIKNTFEEKFSEKLPSAANQLGTINPSTKIDFAAKTGFSYDHKFFGLGIKTLYVGPGFRPVGYPFFVSDRFELMLLPRFTLFNGRLNLNGSVGQRVNAISTKIEQQGKSTPKINVKGTAIDLIPSGVKNSATTQNLLSANLNAQLSDNLSLDFSFSNFGIDNAVLNDTLRIRNIAQGFSFTPVWTLPVGDAWIGNVICNVALDKFTDYNIVSGSINDNDSKIYSLAYQMTGKKNPLTLGLTLGHNNINSAAFIINNNSLTVTTGYKFFKKKLHTTLNITALQNFGLPTPAFTSDKSKDINFVGQFSMRYKASKKTMLQWNVGNNQFYKNVYGQTTRSSAVKELTSTIVLQRTF
jgi:hypothetical protein